MLFYVETHTHPCCLRFNKSLREACRHPSVLPFLASTNQHDVKASVGTYSAVSPLAADEQASKSGPELASLTARESTRKPPHHEPASQPASLSTSHLTTHHHHSFTSPVIPSFTHSLSQTKLQPGTQPFLHLLTHSFTRSLGQHDNQTIIQAFSHPFTY